MRGADHEVHGEGHEDGERYPKRALNKAKLLGYNLPLASEEAGHSGGLA